MSETHAGRILVIDDNEAAAKILSILFSLHGYEVRESHTGKQALLIAKTFSPDIALVDLGMPILDGFEVAKSLQEIRGPDLILIAVTGWKGAAAEARTRKAGFQLHLIKPVDADVLLRHLAELGFPPPRAR